MSLFEGKASQTNTVTREAEGATRAVRLLRSGEIGIVDFIALLSFEGRVFTANVGSATTPVTFNAGGLTTTEFDLHVAVPSTTVIIPLELMVGFEAYGTTLLLESAMQSGSGSVVGTTNTAVTPLSSNVSAGIASTCTIKQVGDAGTAFTTNIKEIWRTNQQKVITLATVTAIREGLPYVNRWFARDSGHYDMVGPNQQLGVWASAQAGTGFIKFVYVELPASAFA